MAVKLWNTTFYGAGFFVSNSIFIDSSGYIHICGWDARASTSHLYYAVSIDGGTTFKDGDGGGSGTYKTLVTLGFPNTNPAIVVDSLGNISVFYTDSGQVKFFQKISGTWGSVTSITGATNYRASINAEIDSDNNLILFGGGNDSGYYYYCCHTSIDGGTTWVEEIDSKTLNVGVYNYQGSFCLAFNSHLYAMWLNSSTLIKETKITKTENSPDSWVVETIDISDTTLYRALSIVAERDSDTIWMFRSYKTGSDYQLQYKKKSEGSWGSWTTIITNTTNNYQNFQSIMTYGNNIYLVYEINGTSNLYYVLWNGSSWSIETLLLASATNCNLQLPNLLFNTPYLYYTYKKSSANEEYFEKFSLPVVEQVIETDTLTLSDEIYANIPLENVIKSDTLTLADNIHWLNEDEEDTDSFSLSDDILVIERPQKAIETDLLSLSDMIDLSQTISEEEIDTLNLSDEIEARLPLAFIHNKFSFMSQIISNINNKFSMLQSTFINWTNKILFRSPGVYSCNNDFRMRASWQVPATGEIQSLGKDYIKVYINTIETTDVDVDSISITKGLNNAHTANVVLARPYDDTIPAIESVIEIKYHIWTLFKGYITQITPTDNPEHIQLSCADEMWKQNKTRVYFLVGHLPYGAVPGELYYKTPAVALSALGVPVEFGNFIPQTVNCWGKAKSESITELINNCGNYGWFYNESDNPILWRAGQGSIVKLNAQQFNQNLGLYDVLSQSFKSDATNIINDLRVQMGIYVDTLGNRSYQSYYYENVYFQPNPTWENSLEILATPENQLGYDFNHPETGKEHLYNDVFKKYSLDAYGTLNSPDDTWSDRYAPRVEINGGGFGWICNKTIGVQKDGYSIDYKNSTLTFNERIYFKKYNEHGECIAVQRPTVFVTLYKKVHQSPTTYPYPLWFYTGKMGTYPTTYYGDLSLSGLSIQKGGFYTDDNGNVQYIPTWNDTTFAIDYANWQLSKTCDEKIIGNINLTLDAVCFYNIDLSKRIQIPGVMNTPLNIINMTYRLSDFQVTLQLENNRTYIRSVSIQSRGEDYF
jgi:hypothetical protein